MGQGIAHAYNQLNRARATSIEIQQIDGPGYQAQPEDPRLNGIWPEFGYPFVGEAFYFHVTT